jgi:hypothetical protein
MADLPASPQVRGVAAVDLFPSIHWNPREGRLLQFSKLVLRSAVVAEEALLQARGFAYTVEPAGPANALIRWTAPPQVIVETWAERFNEQQQSLWLDDAVRLVMDKFTDLTGRANFKADVEAVLAGARTYQDDDNVAQPLTLELIYASALAAYPTLTEDDFITLDLLVEDLANGVESSLPVSAPVLQLSRVFPSFTEGTNPPTPYLPDALLAGPVAETTIDYNGALAELFGDINRIYTTAQLFAAFPTIPVRMQAIYQAITDEATERLGETAGFWLKKAPEGDELEDGRRHYRTEFWYAERLGNLAALKRL